jgi:hypothetical protein
MSSRNRQLVLLVVLIVLFGWLIGRQLGPGSGSGGARSVQQRVAAVSADRVAVEAAEVDELRLAALEHKPAAYRPGRDPFRFGQVPQPKPPPPKPAPVARPVRQEPQPQRPAPPPAPPRPQPPAIDFVYLGSFGLPGREIAVFSDGQEILNAFAGDVLRQEFVVRSIGWESADIAFVNFPDEPAKRLAVGG